MLSERLEGTFFFQLPASCFLLPASCCSCCLPVCVNCRLCIRDILYSTCMSNIWLALGGVFSRRQRWVACAADCTAEGSRDSVEHYWWASCDEVTRYFRGCFGVQAWGWRRGGVCSRNAGLGDTIRSMPCFRGDARAFDPSIDGSFDPSATAVPHSIPPVVIYLFFVHFGPPHQTCAQHTLRFITRTGKNNVDACLWMPQGDLAIYAAELPSQHIVRLFYLGVGLAKLLQVWCVVYRPSTVFWKIMRSYRSMQCFTTERAVLHHRRGGSSSSVP